MLNPSSSIIAAKPVETVSNGEVVVRPTTAKRISALDFTKGVLVLIMVLYHWMNYFLNLSWTYYKYLHFLTPSFIFITGFMISNVYLSKYAAVDPRLPKRLFTRGLKLIAIFLALNLARTFVVNLLGSGVLMQQSLGPRNLFGVFVSGNIPVASGKLVAFWILVPIGYLLMFSGALVLPYRSYKYTFHVVCVALLLWILVLELTGAQSPNLECIAIGMLGLLTGFVPIQAINIFVRHSFTLAFAYLCYALAVSIWDVPFPLLVVGVALSLMVIYLAGASGSASSTIGNEVILLGKYSLLGYISQIAILQILSAAFRHIDSGFAVLAISFVAAFALTIVSVEVVDRARARAASVDRLYKSVFA